MKTRVMLVDDSTIVRELISRALSEDAGIEIVSTAFNGAVAIPLAKLHRPDIIILDIEMPEMDGITALPKLLEASPNSKIIMASTLTLRNAGISLQALQKGASDYVAKPSARDPEDLKTFYRELKEKIHTLSRKTPPSSVAKPAAPAGPSGSGIVKLRPSGPALPVKALAIASSTGGPQALLTLFSGLKNRLRNVPIFITQHMPPNFTTILAEHLAKAGDRPCKEGKDGEIVAPGQTYVAPGDYHMIAEKQGLNVTLRTNKEPTENFCRPAADPMLRSLSTLYGTGLLTVVLTGMGSDGMLGARAVIAQGGRVVAQDEATSVVWGMPRAVAEDGVCSAVLPLVEIAPFLIKAIDYA